MSKQRIVNKGPQIKNGNMIGKGVKTPPIDGSYAQGIDAVRQKMAQAAQQPKNIIKQTAPSQNMAVPKKGITP